MCVNKFGSIFVSASYVAAFHIVSILIVYPRLAPQVETLLRNASTPLFSDVHRTAVDNILRAAKAPPPSAPPPSGGTEGPFVLEPGAHTTKVCANVWVAVLNSVGVGLC